MDTLSNISNTNYEIPPGPTEISEADAYIFRLVCQAVIGRETAPWTFHVVGPDGIQEVTEYEASQATAG